MYHMNNFESPAPKDDSCHVWLKSNHAFSKRRWNSYFLQRAHRGPLGPPWELPWTTFVLHLTRYLHYITWLFSFWIWRRRCLKFAWFWPFGALPLGPHGGHTYYLNNFESPTPKDDSCHFWLKSNHAFSKRRWNSYFLQRAHRGPLGPPWELPWTTFVLHLTRYLHTT